MLFKMRIAIVLLSLVLALPSFAETFVLPKPDPAKIAVHKHPTFDVYRPASSDVVPLLIFVNSTNAPYATWPIYIGWAEAAAEAGIGAVLYQGDFDALMTALRERAGALKIDPSRVVVWSGSTNVSLGLPLAMDRKRDYIRGATVFYGYAQVDAIRTDLPLLYVRSGLDSTGLNKELDATIARAIAANAPWTIENYAGGLHGFEVATTTTSRAKSSRARWPS